MKNPYHWTELIRLTRSERRRFVILIVLLVISVVIQIMVSRMPAKKKISAETLDKYYQQIEILNQDQVKYQFVSFDPNDVTEHQLVNMGLSNTLCRTWIKYRESGVKFNEAKDLLKIYGMDQQLFDQMLPYVNIKSPQKQNNAQRSDKITARSKPVEPAVIITLSPFDPNTITYDALVSAGIPTKLAKTWTNYTAQGGKFKSVKDLHKIYGMTTKLFDKIEPHVVIPSVALSSTVSPDIENKTETNENYKAFKTININQANTEELQNLYGIGPILAERIIKYKKLLGGYHSISQLQEVYGLSVETYESIKEKITVDHSYTKLNIKEMSFKEVYRHPYTTYQSTQELYNYFRFRDQSTHLDSFINKNLIQHDTMQMLRPYLRL